MNKPMNPLTVFIAAIGVICFLVVNLFLGLALVFAAIVIELAMQEDDKRRPL